ncbi:MAG: hypothetical protein A2061_00430 [Gallionellales bacterium GWA2_59_43]|nr:MAG: hypothetical protein A2061_00430 [Gallionellales bacterium GWA2_59_43]
MSVINQVLAQLERRGVHVEQELDMVRAVPPQRSRRMLLAVLLLLLAGAAWWWLARGIDAGGVKQRVSLAVATVAPVMSAIIGPGSGSAAPDIMVSHSAVPVSAVIPQPTVQAVVPVSSVPVVVSASAVHPQIAPQAVAKAKAIVPPKPAALAVQDKPPVKPRIATPAPAASRAVAPKPEVRPDNLRLAPVAPPETGEIPMKQVSRAQQAEAEFRRGVESMQGGRSKDAMASYQAALQLDGAHDAARQALVVLLQEEKRSGDAEQLLQERLKDRPQHTGFAMLLARLQVERGATGEALATLERSVTYAEAKADYQAFLAALQQRNSRHAEAVTHYQAALQLQPGNGAWLMGYGISLQALRRTEEAKAAYQQALESKNLSPDLKAFIQRKLNGL